MADWSSKVLYDLYQVGCTSLIMVVLMQALLFQLKCSASERIKWKYRGKFVRDVKGFSLNFRESFAL